MNLLKKLSLELFDFLKFFFCTAIGVILGIFFSIFILISGGYDPNNDNNNSWRN